MAMTSRYSNLFFYFFKVRIIIERAFHVMRRDVYNNNYILYYDSRIARSLSSSNVVPHPLSIQTSRAFTNTSNYVHRYLHTYRSARTFENIISPRCTHTPSHEHEHALVP